MNEQRKANETHTEAQGEKERERVSEKKKKRVQKYGWPVTFHIPNEKQQQQPTDAHKANTISRIDAFSLTQSTI